MSRRGGEVTLRRAEVDDARGLVTLQREIYREGRWFVGDGAPAEVAMAQRLRAADPQMSLWVVAAAGRQQLCGWLELHRLPSALLRHVATLTLAVAPGWRRLGVGRDLLVLGYDWAQDVGVQKISLNVRASNEGAIRLYQAEGFVLEGRERWQVRTRDGFEDNLIMARFLGDEAEPD
ncbi:MAG: GNAT family N-acetyltransferase [Trueperaceae bacterium]